LSEVYMGVIYTVLATLVTLGILVTIHEWGHYWVARRCGVKVLRFSVGFGKALWSRTGKDGTVYAVAAIPLGGYVKMLDEREAPVPDALKDQAFNNKSVGQRMAIVAAGPIVNLLFAVFAYWLMYLVGVAAVAPVVGSVTPNSIAANAQIPVGAEIVSIDGKPARSWDEINLALASRIGESGSVHLGVIPEGREIEQQLSLQLDTWAVDLEKESPLMAAGVVPYYPDVKPIIGQLVEGGAAKSQGLMVGDLIMAVDEEPVTEWSELVNKIQGSANNPLMLTIERQGHVIEMSLTPDARTVNNQTQGYVGAGVKQPEWPESMRRTLQYGVFDAIPQALDKTWSMISLTLDSIWKMIEGAISVKNLSGPITIAKVAGAKAASGFSDFLEFLAYLSISLGVLNLLPIPVLDGGHLLFYTLELIRGRPVSERIQDIGLRFGMAVLLSLMTLALVNDVMRL
jgi:regulator of sigma E protease